MMKNAEQQQAMRDTFLLMTEEEINTKFDELTDVSRTYVAQITDEIRDVFPTLQEFVNELTLPVQYLGSVIELNRILSDKNAVSLSWNQMKFIQEIFMKTQFRGIKEAENLSDISAAFLSTNEDMTNLELEIAHAGSIVTIKEQEKTTGLLLPETAEANKRAGNDVDESKVLKHEDADPTSSEK